MRFKGVERDGFWDCCIGVPMGRLFVVHARRFLAAGLGLAAAYSLPLLFVAGSTLGAEPASHVRLAQSSDTLTLAKLQEQFTAVADRVAPSVVAISASINALAADDLAQSAELNPQRLGRALDHSTRTVGTASRAGAS